MKKIYSLLMVAAMAFLASCDKNSEEEALSPKENVEGNVSNRSARVIPAKNIYNYMYVVSGDNLYGYYPYDAVTKLVANYGPGFSGTVAMAGVNGNIIYVRNNRLYRFNLATQTHIQLGNGDWSNTTAMTVSLEGIIYAVQGPSLLRVNPNDGSWTVLGTGDWGGTRVLASRFAPGGIMAVQGPYLVHSDTNGNWTVLGNGDWTGTKAMTVTMNYSPHAIQEPYLLSIYSSGDWIRKGTINWYGVVDMEQNYDYAFVMRTNGCCAMLVDAVDLANGTRISSFSFSVGGPATVMAPMAQTY